MSEASSFLKDLPTTWPLLILTLGSLVLLFIRTTGKQQRLAGGVLLISLLGAGITLISLQSEFVPGRIVLNGLLFADPIAYFFSLILLLGTVLSVLLMLGSLEQQRIESPSEFYSLVLMSLVGAMVFASSAEFITLFLGLEIMSMALYCLCGAALSSRSSSESALKYFLLGSFSSAFLLYGIALFYGMTGTMDLSVIGELAPKLPPAGLGIATGLLLIGLLFKLGAVPFHFWTPDVYQGAPTSITAYMACVVKTSAVAVMLRVLWFGLGRAPVWQGFLWFAAILTMVIGNLVAVRQRNVKRMLAYSSIAHVGYLLMAFLVPSREEFGGGTAVLFYLVAYTVMTVGSFAVLLAVGGDQGVESDANDLRRFNRLGITHPALALAMSLFLLALAGLPPGMAGLFGKFLVFSSAVKAHYVGLTVIAALCSAVSCYYYLRIIVAMYFGDRQVNEEDTVEEVLPLTSNTSILGAVALCAGLVILLGIFPGFVYDRAAIVATLW